MAEGDVGGTGVPDWPAVRSFALRAESLGLDSIWVSDHLLPELEALGRPAGIHEAWTVLAGLAEATTTIPIGTLVLAAPFRNPALLAKMAAAADEISGGRLVLGLGTGWVDAEFEAFGYPTDHRGARFDEVLRIVVPLLRGEKVTLDGRFHAANGAVLLPPPRRPIPVLVAAKGPMMLRLAARWADAWITAWFRAPDERFAASMAAMDVALAAEGRDAASLSRYAGVSVSDLDADGPRFGDRVAGLASSLDRFAAVGIDHAVVELEQPMTNRALERLARAVEMHRRGAGRSAR